MNLPNFLSISRVFLLAPIIVFFENDFFFLSLIIYLLAAFTDYLDGLLARKYSQTSDLGSLLDLLADKLFVSILLIWMTFKFDSLVILISSILIVSREISISYLRLFIISKSRSSLTELALSRISFFISLDFQIFKLDLISFSFTQNNYPIVLVHGFMGWGPNEMGSYNYWGGKYDMVKEFEENGHPIIITNVGPISSNWDRVGPDLVGHREEHEVAGCSIVTRRRPPLSVPGSRKCCEF